MEVDYVIVGQGIAGTMLSYYLLQQGNTVIVVDEFNPNSASKVASGVINPVTGRRFVTTWMIETLMPFAQKAYQALEKLLNISIIQQTQLIDFHTTQQMQQAFQQPANDDNTYVSELTNTKHWQQYFQYAHGIGTVQPVFHIQLQTLLSTWRNYLHQQQILIQEVFSLQSLTLSSNSITYRNIKAKAIIFCNGVLAMHLPYFNKLPFAPNKGDALILYLPNLPTQYLYKHGISLIPWQYDLWWAGSFSTKGNESKCDGNKKLSIFSNHLDLSWPCNIRVELQQCTAYTKLSTKNNAAITTVVKNAFSIATTHSI
jgi:glycine/D-amino acid oxidase-like deaminating enzyme